MTFWAEEIPEAQEGVLLRNYLLGSLGISHRLLVKLKSSENGILLNGKRVTVRAVLHAGDRLELNLPALQECRDFSPDGKGASEETPCLPGDAVPPDTEAGTPPCPTVLWQDEDLLVFNKPGNMPTHPSHGHRGDTLSDAVLALPGLLPDGVFRPVNRLDAETSGIVLVARHQPAAARLSEALSAGRLQKQYFALLRGELPVRKGLIDCPIRRAKEGVILRECCPSDAPGAQNAVTRYRVIGVRNGHTLVAAQPLTGRTHQLRVHFASLGAPILGDWLYGSGDSDTDIDRQALHAGILTFPHPRDGRLITLCAPLPADFRHLLKSDSVQDKFKS